MKDAIKEIIDFHTELTEEDGYSDAINKAHSEITELHKDLFTKDENGISKSDRLNSDIQQIEKFSKELRDEIAPYLSATRTDIDTKKNEI